MKKLLRDAAFFAELTELVASGKLKPLISATYTLEQTAQALIDLNSRKVQGKIVIVP